jgi:DNA repair protein RadC
MIREVAIRYVGARWRVAEKLASPAEVARYFRRRIHDHARKHFVALYLDGRHRAIADAIVSIGTATASLVYLREIFQPAIAVGACALLIGHNHPNGDPTPSPEDLEVTRG